MATFGICFSAIWVMANVVEAPSLLLKTIGASASNATELVMALFV